MTTVLFANLGDFPYVLRRLYFVYAMPKTVTRDIHGRYQYDTDKLGLDVRKPMQENRSSGLVNNKGGDQLAHPRSLISAFVFRSLKSIISRLAKSESSIF